ncbi:hypothetical protein FAM09_12945 [Niastella caeni]|uniref:RHS repeat protein n=1 Tax=Niastella caeni TaxID=2569763 RepID=A0A4V4H181_9BACT|nr:hypothetical protein [Niastella caeni]THU39406.1 hypothetical protein FAM09_12945 [Niastella caeni]
MNRLVAMDAWHKTGSAWSNITKLTDFQERISYDANGNILGYKRNGNNSFASKQLLQIVQIQEQQMQISQGKL